MEALRALSTRAIGCQRRGRLTSPRSQLVIDPGPRTISGVNGHGALDQSAHPVGQPEVAALHDDVRGLHVAVDPARAVQPVQRFAELLGRLAAEAGVRSMAGIGLNAYGGVYYEGNSPHSLENHLQTDPHLYGLNPATSRRRASWDGAQAEKQM